MNIHHEHHHPDAKHRRYGKSVLIAILASLVVMGVEFYAYLVTGSLALLGDAGHMLMDVLGLSMTYVALRIASRPADDRATFGYQRAEVLAAMIHGILLLIVAALLIRESIEKLRSPAEFLDGRTILMVGILGLLTNVFVAYLLFADGKKNINIRAALIDVLGDGLASVGVIVGSLLVTYTGRTVWDPVVSLFIAGVLLFGGGNLLRQTGSILLERAPPTTHPREIRRVLQGHPGVKNVHDLHVWSQTLGSSSLTAHITLDAAEVHRFYEVTHELEELLRERFQLTHCTIQLEPEGVDHESELYDPFEQNDASRMGREL